MKNVKYSVLTIVLLSPLFASASNALNGLDELFFGILYFFIFLFAFIFIISLLRQFKKGVPTLKAALKSLLFALLPVLIFILFILMVFSGL